VLIFSALPIGKYWLAKPNKWVLPNARRHGKVVIGLATVLLGKGQERVVGFQLAHIGIGGRPCASGGGMVKRITTTYV
jgi:hypothetical protein